MGYFQVPNDRNLFHSQSKLNTWPVSADGYRLFATGNGGPERIGVQTGKEIELSLVIEQNKVLGKLNSSNLKAVVPGIVGPVHAKPMRIKISAIADGTADITATSDSGETIAGPVTVAAGKFENQKDMDVDLIAEVCRGSDSLKIHALQRMLNNNDDHAFDQNGPSNTHKDFGNMACGIVAKFRGDEVFGFMGKVQYDNPYHELLKGKVTDRNQVKYKPEKIQSLRTHIGAMLRQGKPVRVGVLDVPQALNPIGGKLVAYYAGGHSVLIVGADKANKRFLYIDPWTGGSKLKYEGGIIGNKFSAECQAIGYFDTEFEPARKLKSTDTRENIIRQSTTTEGSFSRANGNFLEVVAGPWLL